VKRSKRYREAVSRIDRTRTYTIEEAVGALKESPAAKFDETVEVCVKLGIDTTQSDQLVRGAFSLPKGIGKQLRVVVFAEGEPAEEAKKAGAMEVGGQELVKKVEEGFMDFDVAIAAPEMMRLVGRLGRVLGPKGLMPSPKSGTVTKDIAAAVREFAAGKIEYRTDKTGNVHAPVGKKSFSKEDLVQNINSFVEHIKASKPAAVRGRFIEKVALSTSMGPGLRLQVN
jgi:large subunit ribosomal protein L1